jgi:hypothetical protein
MDKLAIPFVIVSTPDDANEPNVGSATCGCCGCVFRYDLAARIGVELVVNTENLYALACPDDCAV